MTREHRSHNHLVEKRQARNPKMKTLGEESTLFSGRRVLGDGLGALRDGVLGQFTGEDQTDSVELLVPCR